MTEPTAAALASLPKITDTNWELSCSCLAEKAEMLAYADDALVPIHDGIQKDRDRHLEWWTNAVGKGAIWANPQREKKPLRITPEQFKAMCDAYAATRHTAPAAPHGVRDLLLGLVFALLFSALLPSCAGPARLPERPVVRHAEHDSRTKLVEPTPPRLK